jgi:hypothetical protein
MNPAELPLRDIHLPPGPSWWPPAPGWWIAVGVVIATIAALSIWRWSRRRPLNLRRSAEIEWMRIREDYGRTRDAMRVLRELSALSRRIALSVLPRSEVAGVSGAAWLAVLDRLSGTREFTSGIGQVLADAPYRREAAVDIEAVMALCGQLVGALARPSAAVRRMRSAPVPGSLPPAGAGTLPRPGDG